MYYSNARSAGRRPLMTAIAAAVATLLCAQASAVKIEVGNEDTEVRFDNTVKYNAGWRVQERNKAMGDTWSLQAGEYIFDKGDLVTNRLDLLSELDIVYKTNYGMRVSGAAWKDFAYDDNVRGNPAYQAAGLGTAYPNNKFPRSVSRYYTRSGEVLDAFVFGRINFGDRPLDIKVGRHTVYWGESLFSPIHGVSYSQGPADFQKGVATPGIEAKEFFRPTNQISTHLQVNEKISLAAQYYLEWKPYRIYEGGTYFTAADPLFQGGTSFAPNGALPYSGNLSSGPDAVPNDRGSWGVMMKAQSETIDGTVGLYFRKFDDAGPSVVSTGGLFGDLHNAYAKDVKLIGVSLAKSIGGVSVGAELVHRKNTALATNFGAAQIARGDSWSGLVNALAYIGKTPAFDSAVLLAELTYSKLDKVYGSSVAYFNSCKLTGAKRVTGCATDDALGFAMTFTPTWFQALPSLDLTLPIHYDRGLMGNSPLPFGGAKKDGTWSIGLGADYQAKYKFDLTYHGYFGEFGTAPNPYAGVPGIGPLGLGYASGNGLLRDRGWVSLTVKTSF